MRIKTFLILFFSSLILFAGVNTTLGFILEIVEKDIGESQKKMHESFELAQELVFSSQWLTRFSRGYVATKDPTRLTYYHAVEGILDGKTETPRDYDLGYWDLVAGGFIPFELNNAKAGKSIEDRFLSLNITTEEYSKLKDARIQITKSSVMEKIAMHAVNGEYDDGTGTFTRKGKPDRAMAERLIYSEEYNKINGDISLLVKEFNDLVKKRFSFEVSKKEAYANSLLFINLYTAVALSGMILVALLFLTFRLAKRATYLLNSVEKISAGDLSVRTHISGNDELSQLSNSIDLMADNLRSAFVKLEEKIELSQKALIELDNERNRSEKLLHNILPAAIAERLREGEETIAEIFPEVTVAFSDIVGFTELSATLGPHKTVQMLSEIFGELDELAEKHSVEKIKTIGDCYMVVGGVPNRDNLHCQHIANFALDAMKVVENFSTNFPVNVRMRMGIHTGTVAAGVVGKKKFSYDLWGDVVNIASRFETTSSPDRIHVSEAIKVRLSDDFIFFDGGEIDLKGKGMTRSYYLLGRKENTPQLDPLA